jgi:hypothetical protein
MPRIIAWKSAHAHSGPSTSKPEAIHHVMPGHEAEEEALHAIFSALHCGQTGVISDHHESSFRPLLTLRECRSKQRCRHDS